LSCPFNLVHQSHICDTAWIGHPHAPQCGTQIKKKVVMLGVVTPAPADAGLNPDDKGK